MDLQDANGNPLLHGGMYRNLIINGDMMIDQRNAGASATTNVNAYMTDRFQLQMGSVTNVQTYQQVGDAPAGFNKSLKITSNSTTQATAAGVLCSPRQKIEGFNTAHLNWGTANAQTVTVSFWVKASVTGTYPVSLTNNGFDRSFVTNYTVSVANTWEYKTVTIAGDTSGTWSIDNSTGINVMFSLDTGSTYQTTADSWQTGNYRGTSSDVHFLANASATWQITGVQLEVGEGASDFEFLPYDVQLQRCQRYYYLHAEGTSKAISIGALFTSSVAYSGISFPVDLRSEPSIEVVSPTNFKVFAGNGASNATGVGLWSRSGTTNTFISVTGLARTGGQACMVTTNNAACKLAFSAEL